MQCNQFFTFFIVLCEKKAVIKTLYNLTKIFIIELNQFIDSIRLGNNKKQRNPQN